MALSPDKFVQLVEKEIKKYAHIKKSGLRDPWNALLSGIVSGSELLPVFGFTGPYKEIDIIKPKKTLFRVGIEYRFPLNPHQFDQSQAISSFISRGIIQCTVEPSYRPDDIAIGVDLQSEEIIELSQHCTDSHRNYIIPCPSKLNVGFKRFLSELYKPK